MLIVKKKKKIIFVFFSRVIIKLEASSMIKGVTDLNSK